MGLVLETNIDSFKEIDLSVNKEKKEKYILVNNERRRQRNVFASDDLAVSFADGNSCCRIGGACTTQHSIHNL